MAIKETVVIHDCGLGEYWVNEKMGANDHAVVGEIAHLPQNVIRGIRAASECAIAALPGSDSIN